MTRLADMTPLERRYRRFLVLFPRADRAGRGEELVATLLDLAPPDRFRPSFGDAADLVAVAGRAHCSRARARAAAPTWKDGLGFGGGIALSLEAIIGAALLLHVGLRGQMLIPGAGVSTRWLVSGASVCFISAFALLVAGFARTSAAVAAIGAVAQCGWLLDYARYKDLNLAAWVVLLVAVGLWPAFLLFGSAPVVHHRSAWVVTAALGAFVAFLIAAPQPHEWWHQGYFRLGMGLSAFVVAFSITALATSSWAPRLAVAAAALAVIECVVTVAFLLAVLGYEQSGNPNGRALDLRLAGAGAAVVVPTVFLSAVAVRAVRNARRPTRRPSGVPEP